MTESKPAYLIERPFAALATRPQPTLTSFQAGLSADRPELVEAEWFKSTADGRLEFFIGAACIRVFLRGEWDTVKIDFDWD